MSVERDPELGNALDLALPSPNPPYGAKLRVRRKLDERLSNTRRSASTGIVAGALLLACAVALFVGFDAVTSRNALTAGRSVLTLGSARIVLRHGATVAVERDDATGSVLRLTSGTVLLHVRKGTTRSFEVIAGGTRVRVVGTVFGVALDEKGAAVEVIEGSVEVRDAGGTRRLRAGEAWPSGRRLFGDLGELELVRAPLPAPTASSGSPGAPSSGAGAPEILEAETLDVLENPAGRARSSHREPRPETSATKESAYTRARNLERSGDAEGALAAYEAIVDARGENLEDALFALGRLRAQRGDQRAALALAERYRNEFPSGRYARDNDVLVLNAEIGLGDQAAALRESENFLSHFPNDPRAWRFRLVRAADRVRRGDCGGARLDVETAPDGAAKQSVLESCPAERR